MSAPSWDWGQLRLQLAPPTPILPTVDPKDYFMADLNIPSLDDLLSADMPPEMVAGEIHAIMSARRNGAYCKVIVDVDDMTVRVALGAEMHSLQPHPTHTTITFIYPPIG